NANDNFRRDLYGGRRQRRVRLQRHAGDPQPVGYGALRHDRNAHDYAHDYGHDPSYRRNRTNPPGDPRADRRPPPVWWLRPGRWLRSVRWLRPVWRLWEIGRAHV